MQNCQYIFKFFIKYYLIILIFDIISKYLQYIATLNITDTNVYNVHIVINNGSYETVGGQPTVMNGLDISQIAAACGYPVTTRVEDFDELDAALALACNTDELMLIEIMSSIGSRDDLGRPTTTAIENKNAFMKYIE